MSVQELHCGVLLQISALSVCRQCVAKIPLFCHVDDNILKFWAMFTTQIVEIGRLRCGKSNTSAAARINKAYNQLHLFGTPCIRRTRIYGGDNTIWNIFNKQYIHMQHKAISIIKQQQCQFNSTVYNIVA